MRSVLLPACVFGVALTLTAAARADDWPQWMGPNRDGVWRETGIVAKFPKDGPKARWRTPVGYGYAGPAVAGGKVYVTDFVPNEGVRMTASGFGRSTPAGKERDLCLKESTGEVLWKHEYPVTYQVGYPGGPRTTPAVSGGKVYALGTMGHLVCLDAEKGKPLWSKNFMKDYGAPAQTWGFSGSPLVDGNKLICLVGGAGSVAVAFDKDSGKELWKSVSGREQGYAPPV